MAVITGSRVNFTYVSGSELPNVVDSSTIYFVEGIKTIYVGNVPLADLTDYAMIADTYAADIQVEGQSLELLNAEGDVLGSVQLPAGFTAYQLTTSQYNALPDADKSDPAKLYFISDASEPLVSKGIRYRTIDYLADKAEVLEITQAEYDLLPSSVKQDPNKLFLIVDNIQYLTTEDIQFNTTAGWAAQASLVSVANRIYVYTDHQVIDNKNVPGFKVGDGVAYLIDLPFSDQAYIEHINDSNIHVSAADRLSWENKVSCSVESGSTKLVFSTD